MFQKKIKKWNLFCWLKFEEKCRIAVNSKYWRLLRQTEARDTKYRTFILPYASVLFLRSRIEGHESLSWHVRLGPIVLVERFSDFLIFFWQKMLQYSPKRLIITKRGTKASTHTQKEQQQAAHHPPHSSINSLACNKCLIETRSPLFSFSHPLQSITYQLPIDTQTTIININIL